eukprot:GHVP01030150.1.p1 GENE.GHVP01030150.1~~GHVP01030150.1.p1  ORF type:complete len:461 (-),score=114.13 GHVP01030150.1:286-1668(-)
MQEESIIKNAEMFTDMKEESFQEEMSKEDLVADEPSLNESQVAEELLKEQMKYCGVVLRSLKRHRDAGAFLHPVDPIALNIPDYLEVIKTPMDFNTVTENYNQGKYTTPAEFMEDVQLILNNCFTYNKPDTFVYKGGKNLERSFLNTMEKMPRELSQIQKRSREKPLPTVSSAGSVRTKGGMSVNDTTYCHNIMKEIMKKKNQAIIYPFIEPVDPIALNIPDYFTVITEPMDLSTVKRKLDDKVYDKIEDFKNDLILIVTNCCQYNVKGTAVYNMGLQLEAIIKEVFEATNSGESSKAKSTSVQRPKPVRKQQTEFEMEKEIAWRRQEIENQLNKIDDLTKKLGRTGERGMLKRKGTEKDEDLPLTREEKTKLSEAVSLMTNDETEQIISIIRESNPDLPFNPNEEQIIEIDMERLSTMTMRKMQKYITDLEEKRKQTNGEEGTLVKSFDNGSDEESNMV